MNYFFICCFCIFFCGGVLEFFDVAVVIIVGLDVGFKFFVGVEEDDFVVFFFFFGEFDFFFFVGWLGLFLYKSFCFCIMFVIFFFIFFKDRLVLVRFFFFFVLFIDFLWIGWFEFGVLFGGIGFWWFLYFFCRLRSNCIFFWDRMFDNFCEICEVVFCIVVFFLGWIFSILVIIWGFVRRVLRLIFWLDCSEEWVWELWIVCFLVV